ncbi:MAG: type II/IV secretion system protein, partial [Bacteroidota bacterium]
MEILSYNIPIVLQQRITAEQAYHYRIVPVSETDDTLVFKTDRPVLDDLLTELRIILDTPLDLERCGREELQRYLSTNYREPQNAATGKLEYSTDFLEKMVWNAKQVGSSDIHFEPYEKKCRVRFRLDGKLLEQFSITLTEYPTIINKI